MHLTVGVDSNGMLGLLAAGGNLGSSGISPSMANRTLENGGGLGLVPASAEDKVTFACFHLLHHPCDRRLAIYH